jgi:hypothetical protein
MASSLCAFSQFYDGILWGFSVQPEIAHRWLSVDESRAGQNLALPSILDFRKNEFPVINICGGLHGQKQKGRTIWEIGIQYQQTGTQMKSTLLNVMDPAAPTQIIQRTKFTYLEIPLLYKYAFGSGAFIATGLQVGALLRSENIIYFIYETGKNRKERDDIAMDVRSYAVSPIVQCGINIHDNDHSRMSLQSSFKVNIVPPVNAPIREYYWNMGLGLGYFFK